MILQGLAAEGGLASRSDAAGFFLNDHHDPTEGFQTSLLIELEELDWGSILDNKSDGHARRG
jgi:hypothetical protein